MKESTIQALDKYFASHEGLRVGPVDSGAIDAGAAELGAILDPDYRFFVQRYGAGTIGSGSIIGIGLAQSMGNEESSFVKATQHFRAEGWPGAEEWTVISIDHAGNPVGIDSRGKLMTFDHDLGEFIDVAPSFEAFVEALLRTAF